MPHPRTIVEGLKSTKNGHADDTNDDERTPSIDPAKEREIVFGAKANTNANATPPDASTRPSPKRAKAALNTRIRADFSAALKRASLQRQMDEVYPNTIADIVEEALEPWLRANGYFA